MTTDVTDRRAPVVISRGAHRLRGLILLLVAVFQFWLWGTRIYNLFTSDEEVTAAFVAAHALLYITATAAGILLAVLGVRMLREAAAAARR